MRNAILRSISEKFSIDANLIVILGDLGVFQMRKAMAEYPSRVINFGIMEQTMIGFAAGLSRGGYYPIIYSITPFLVDRGFEQIKIDLIYNKNPCLILSAGGSFDYSTLGPTHHCQHDVANLMAINHPLISIPFCEQEAIEHVNYAVHKKTQCYLRICSSELKLTNSNYKNYSICLDKKRPLNNSLSFKKFVKNISENQKKLLVLFGPDAQFFQDFNKLVTTSDSILKVSFITNESIKLLASEINNFEEVIFLIPYEPSNLITKLIGLIRKSEKIPSSILTIHPKNKFFDQSYEKKEIFSKFSDITKII